jgi:hypothetical protein
MRVLAADYLIDRLDQRVVTPARQEIEVEQVLRGSSAPPPRARAR